MGTRVSRIRRWAAACLMSGFIFTGGMPVVTAPRGETPRPVRTDWPRSFVAGNGATVTIHQPQIAEWPNQSAVTFYAAVAYRPSGAPAALGTVAVEADTTVAFRDRRVHFSRFAVVDASFPTLQPAEVSAIVALIEKQLPADERTMTLDEVLAAVELRPAAPKNIRGLKADPPPIFISTRPAALVNIDGSPIWHLLGKGPLQYAVNTNWDLIRDPASATYFLRDGRSWLTSSNVLGPWTRPRTLPASFNDLNGPRWESAHASVPPSTATPARTRAVFVSRQPAELIEFAGEPVYRPVPGTAKLQWVSNTESDVFREGRAGTVYYLVAGRWFAAPDFTGPWTFATAMLPAEFRKIPLEHPRSHVLASVPGTPQAAAAVLLAQARHAARVNKKELKAPAVAYDGPASFLLIPDTPVARAINTDKDVLKAGRLYYLCHDGVWFSADTATGPWRVTGTIPAAIYQIPPSSPAYRVTNVVVEDDYEDWAVFATTAAYSGTMVAGDTVVWGTGIGYVSYVGRSDRDPMYVARPSTYGVGAWYNPWTATFGRGRSGYGPSPAEGLAARAYDSWDVRQVQSADRTGESLPAARDVVGTTGQLTRAIPTNRDGHVYAGRDGVVYRQRAGVWEKYGKAGWIAVTAPSANDAPIVRQLDADARARTSGAERTRVAVGLEREWGPRAASYHPVSSVRRGEP